MWFPPFDDCLSLSGPPQLIHRVVIQPLLPEFEAALPLPRPVLQFCGEILAQFTLLQERTSCTAGRGGVGTEPFTSSSQVKWGGDISEPLQHLGCSLIPKALMPQRLIQEFGSLPWVRYLTRCLHLLLFQAFPGFKLSQFGRCLTGENRGLNLYTLGKM